MPTPLQITSSLHGELSAGNASFVRPTGEYQRVPASTSEYQRRAQSEGYRGGGEEQMNGGCGDQITLLKARYARSLACTYACKTARTRTCAAARTARSSRQQGLRVLSHPAMLRMMSDVDMYSVSWKNMRPARRASTPQGRRVEFMYVHGG
eukprot:6200843-Pleurochrysis_carterae.AAC.5